MSEFTPQSILEDYQSYISRLPQGINDLINHFREGRNEIAFVTLKDFSEGLTWLLSASDYLKASEIAVQFDASKVIEALNEVNESLINHDFLLVADILEYELYPYFTELVQN